MDTFKRKAPHSQSAPALAQMSLACILSLACICGRARCSVAGAFELQPDLRQLPRHVGIVGITNLHALSTAMQVSASISPMPDWQSVHAVPSACHNFSACYQKNIERVCCYVQAKICRNHLSVRVSHKPIIAEVGSCLTKELYEAKIRPEWLKHCQAASLPRKRAVCCWK